MKKWHDLQLVHRELKSESSHLSSTPCSIITCVSKKNSSTLEDKNIINMPPMSLYSSWEAKTDITKKKTPAYCLYYTQKSQHDLRGPSLFDPHLLYNLLFMHWPFYVYSTRQTLNFFLSANIQVIHTSGYLALLFLCLECSASLHGCSFSSHSGFKFS